VIRKGEARLEGLQAILERNRSSGPKMELGRTMVTSGNSALIASSPSALVRRKAEGESLEAPRAETWTSLVTPASRQALPILRAPSTWVSLKGNLLHFYIFFIFQSTVEKQIRCWSDPLLLQAERKKERKKEARALTESRNHGQ